MKKSVKITSLAVGILLACSTAVACGETQAQEGSVSLDVRELVLKPGESHLLTATWEGEGAAVWKSDDESVARVSDGGEVLAVSYGNAVISVTVGQKSDYCQVTVNEAGEATLEDEIRQEGYLYYEDFEGREQVPSYLRTITTGGGTLSVFEGSMKLNTVGTGSAFANYLFDEALTGKIIAETRVRVTSTSFSNVLFFYRGETGYDTNDVVACLGMDAGGFKNHNGSGWSGPIMRYSVGQWYEIRMELDIGKGKYDLYIDGVQMPSQSFRKTGDGVEDRIKLLKFGTDKENAGMEYDYIKISQGSQNGAPEIEMPALTYTALAGVDTSLSLSYQAMGTPRPTVSVLNPNTDVFTVEADNRTVRFAENPAPGEYLLTLRAENTFGVTEKTVTVIVKSNANELLSAQFTGGSGGFVLSGDAVVEDGNLVLKTPSTGGSVSAMYTFDECLSGKVYAEVQIVNKMNATFTNVLFTYRKGTLSVDASTCTTSLAIENGQLKYHDGKGWKNIVSVEEGATLTIGVEYDFTQNTMDVYLNGVLVLDGGSMRRASTDTAVLIIGSTKANTHILYDYVKFVRVEA